MAELFIDPGKAFASGYEAQTTVGEDIQSGSMLKKAYEKTEADPTTGTKDMFKVNSIAAQMALSSGKTRLADKFEKQAEASKKSSLENQLTEIKTQDAKFGQLEKKLQLINTADDGIKATLDSDMPDDVKMRVVSMFKEAGNDPEKITALKDKFQNAAMDAKDRLSAQQKVLQMQLNAELKREGMDLRRDMMGITAGMQQATLDERKDFHNKELELKREQNKQKQEAADENLLLNYDKLEIQAGKIKNEEARKKAFANLKKRREAAEDRMAGRDVEEGQPDSKGRHIAKPGGSKEERQTEAIKKALGKDYDPKKKYTVDKDGNIYEE